MKFNNLLGQIHISNSTIFDSHLLWLIIPVIFTVFLFFAKPSKWDLRAKNITVKSSAALLIISVTLAVVLRYPSQSFNETVSSLSIFNNLDIIVALLFGITLISKRFWLTRILIPGAIVISLTRLINNPGADIAYAELIVDLVLICSAIILVPVFNRSITVSAHITLVVSTLAVLASQVTLKAKESSKLEKGDIAVFDFEGFIDGTPFPGGKAANYELEIGSGQFIAGFEDQMVNLEKGAEKDVNVTFPEEYHVPELKAKPAVFKIKLNDIKVKAKPELNDEWVASLNIPAAKTVAELKTYIKDVQGNELSIQARGAFQRQAFDKIVEQATITIPAQLVAKEMHAQEHNFEAKLKEQGLSIKQYMDMTGMNKEAIASQFKKAAETRLKDSFIFAEIAKLEKIEIKDEDYEKEYAKFAKVYGQSLDNIKQMVTKSQMQIPMTNDRVLDILIAANERWKWNF